MRTSVRGDLGCTIVRLSAPALKQGVFGVVQNDGVCLAGYGFCKQARLCGSIGGTVQF